MRGKSKKNIDILKQYLEKNNDIKNDRTNSGNSSSDNSSREHLNNMGKIKHKNKRAGYEDIRNRT